MAALTVTIALLASSGPPAAADHPEPSGPPAAMAPVVVATFDTGVNPFHPCFRRPDAPHPSAVIPGYPSSTPELVFSFRGSYGVSLRTNQDVLDTIQPLTLYSVAATNLSYYGGQDDPSPLIDSYPHGTQAASQIGCSITYGLGTNAHVVVLDNMGGSGQEFVRDPERLVMWAADQDWVDVIHLNIQDYPLLVERSAMTDYAVGRGKAVVIAAGNGVYGAGANYPSELSKYTGPPGSLVAGANDEEGWTIFSNLDPHVVMDGGDTIAASPYSYGEAWFGGTSSSSPRLTGYVAAILGRLRAEFGHDPPGLVNIPAGADRPASGPLSDGVLDRGELFEVVRKTADPNPHHSRYDGERSIWYTPQPARLPVAWYSKVGYGEVSEHTIDAAVDVAAGRVPMPSRPIEDAMYTASEAARAVAWADGRPATTGSP